MGWFAGSWIITKSQYLVIAICLYHPINSTCMYGLKECTWTEFHVMNSKHKTPWIKRFSVVDGQLRSTKGAQPYWPHLLQSYKEPLPNEVPTHP
jgi:hypothetical protein